MTLRYGSYLLAVLLAFAAVPRASAQSVGPYTFSARVGAIVEPDERVLYGLFPEVRGFERATAYVTADDSVHVVILRPTADTTLAMPRATADALGRFIETFGRYRTAPAHPEWTAVSPYVWTSVLVPYVEDSGLVVFSVGGGGSLPLPGAQRYTFYSNFVGEDAEQEVEVAGSPALEVSLALRPRPWLSVGGSAYLTPTPGTGSSDLQEVVYSMPRFRAFAELNLTRLRQRDGRFGFAVGSGLLFAESVVSQRFPENDFTTYSPEGYDLSARGPAPFLSATAEYRILPEGVLFGRLIGWKALSVEVPLTEVQSVAFPGTVVYRVEPHAVEYGQVGLVVGLRVGSRLWPRP